MPFPNRSYIADIINAFTPSDEKTNPSNHQPKLKKLATGYGVKVLRFDRPKNSAGGIYRSSALKIVFKTGVYKTCVRKNTLRVASRRLVKEAKILRSLHHPNIVRYLAFIKLPDERNVLAMERCDFSLGDLIKKMGRLETESIPPLSMMKLCKDICSGLHYLHNTAHLLHGDIKSFNILVNNMCDTYKLCDFGVSLPLNTEGFIDLRKKKNAVYRGNPVWSAPEALDEVEPISFKADIFSFGLVLYECITLKIPHEGIPREHLMVVVGTRPNIPFVDQLDKMYRTLIDVYYDCTNKLPMDRPTANQIVSTINSSEEWKYYNNTIRTVQQN